jgi:hypothetical protein
MTPVPLRGAPQDFRGARPSPLATYGDPPESIYAFAGHGGVVYDSAPKNIWEFTLAGIPSGSTIERAYLWITDWWEYYYYPPTLTVHFNGYELTEPPAVVTNSGFYYLVLYRFDVTAYVSGDGTYTYSRSNQRQPYGDFLAAVWSRPDAPPCRLEINDGATYLYQSSSTSVFLGFEEGPGALVLFTQADDDWPLGPESILFNSTVLEEGEDVFNERDGPVCSTFTYDVTLESGNNPVTLSTSEDVFGWHVAILSSRKPPLEVVDVAFDFEDGTSDGQDIRINLDKDVCTINPNIFDDCKDNRGEWVIGVRSHPAALLSTAYEQYYHPGPMRVRARFQVEPREVQCATVSADSLVFGNFGEQQATFGADGKSQWIEFTTDGIRPASVQFLDDIIQWKVKDIDGVPSDWSNINTSSHRLYFLLGPGYPGRGEPCENQHEPWADVLQYSALWAAGKSIVDDVDTEITKTFYDSNAYWYDENGNPRYALFGGAPPYSFKLKKFLEDLSRTTWFKSVNCHDMAMAVAVFSSSLGSPTGFRFVATPGGHRKQEGMKPIVVDAIDLIGTMCPQVPSTCPTNNVFFWLYQWPQWGPGDDPPFERPGGFKEHGFASLQVWEDQPHRDVAYDATAKIDIDNDPDDPPGWYDYVLRKELKVGDYLYEGLRDWNDCPPSDFMGGARALFYVNGPE